MRVRLCIIGALLALLAMPRTVWAQDVLYVEYPIWIGDFDETKPGGFDGTRITSDNASDVLGGGKVSYDNGVLTLNGANIDGCIYSDIDLTIELIGDNQINVNDSAAFKCLNAASMLSLTFSGTGSLLVFNANFYPANYNFVVSFAGGMNLWGNLDTPNTSSLIASQILGGGDGTDSSPFLIGSFADLEKLATYTNMGLLNGQYFALSQDIDCDGNTMNDPIGISEDTPFIGIFNGNDYTISNLNGTKGLFGTIGFNDGPFGTVTNVKLAGCSFTNSSKNSSNSSECGTIAGWLNSGTIQNCAVTNCNVSGNSYGQYYGGIVGKIYDGTVQECTVTSTPITSGAVKNTSTYMGGIAGYIGSTYGVTEVSIKKCTFSESQIKTDLQAVNTNYLGGIVGYIKDTNTGSVDSCKVTKGAVINNNTTQYVGAIYGENSSSGTTFKTNTYDFDVEVSAASVTRTGYNSRGTGTKDANDNYDLLTDDGAVLYTQPVTLLNSATTGQTIMEANALYYRMEGSNYFIAPNQQVRLNTVPSSDIYTTAWLQAINTTANDVIVTDSADFDGEIYRQYSFTMPDAPVTVTSDFAFNLSSNNITASIDDVTYTGNAQEPATIKVTGIDGVTSSITNGTDFTVTGCTLGSDDASPVEPSTYTVTIKGMGSYLGTKDVSYTINKADLNIVTIADIENQIYTGSEITLDELTVTLNGNAVSADEYNISYSNNINVSETDLKAVVAISAKATSDHFLEGTMQTAEFTIVPKSIAGATITLSSTELEYNGENQAPTITSVKDGDRVLTFEEDYTITNNGGTDADEYEVIITGMGNYDSQTTARTTFNITRKELSPDVEFSSTPVYDGTAQTPEPLVYYQRDGNPDRTVLYLGNDYTVEYSDNINAGNQAKLTLTMIGNYQGESTYTFTILQADFADVTVANIDEQTYTGSEITPAVTVSFNGNNISAEEYAISYSNNTNAGTATVTLTSNNKNFSTTNTNQTTFTIIPKTLTQEMVTLSSKTFEYNGETQKPTVTVTDGSTVLTTDDYSLQNEGGKNVGSYNVVVSGKNNYTGEVTLTFNIITRTVTLDELGLSDSQTYATYYSDTEDLVIPDGVVAYIITGVSGTSVTTKRISSIPSGVPVLVEKGTSTETATDVTTGNQLLGTSTDKDVSTITGGTIYVLYKDEFVKTTSGTIPAHRCYLVVSDGGNGARRLSIVHGDDGSTGIENLMQDESGDKWYDLLGHPIQKPTKAGLYINNGKKTVVK